MSAGRRSRSSRAQEAARTRAASRADTVRVICRMYVFMSLFKIGDIDFDGLVPVNYGIGERAVGIVIQIAPNFHNSISFTCRQIYSFL